VNAVRPDPMNSSPGGGVGALREYLGAHNGIKGLEVLEPFEVDRAVRIFNRDGFVVVRDALDAEQLAVLRAATEDAARQIIALDPDRSGKPRFAPLLVRRIEHDAKHAAPTGVADAR